MLRLLAAALLAAAPLRAGDPLDPVEMAEMLSKTTVSVRISSAAAAEMPPSNAGRPVAAPPVANASDMAETIYLASGVSLGHGLIVTFCTAPMSARFRATLHDGQQTDAELRVADDYSGLRLIEVANRELPRLELAVESPKLGAAVMSAAAMGLEDPLVSLGIVSGADYRPAGVELPPMLVCDVRSAETSNGGPVMDRDGKLVGVVAATSNAAQKPGWTYAIPARHVQRLVQAKADNQIVLLRRQRPVAGFTLGAGAKDGVVRVERVETGGPAERAGIKPGDVLLEADGRKIRSAYQAIDLILRKQPGDRVPLVIEQSGNSKSLTMLLAGTTASQTYNVDPSLQVGPQVNVTMVSPDKIEVRRTLSEEAKPAPARYAQDEVAALKAQLAAFEQSVERLQEELRRRDQTQVETNKLIESMTTEMARLRKRLESKEE
jgi:serine protease Do